MKSPFLIFLPAAIGAAGIYFLAQPGQREALLSEGVVPEVRDAGGWPTGGREWGGSRPSPEAGSLDEDSAGARIPRSGSSARRSLARRSLGERETAVAGPLRGGVAGAEEFRPAAGKARHSRGDLERRAAQVEREANRELERLIPVLGLTEAQQQRIFAVLVRHSGAFHPDMRVETVGETVLPEDETHVGATKDEELYTALEPHQQVVMEELYEDQAAWWQDVVEHLVPDSVIPGLGGDEPPMMGDEKPSAGEAGGKDVTGTVRPPSP